MGHIYPFIHLYIMRSIYLQEMQKTKCLWLENDKPRLIKSFMRFFKGVEGFNLEMVSKTPNIVFFLCFHGFLVQK